MILMINVVVSSRSVALSADYHLKGWANASCAVSDQVLVKTMKNEDLSPIIECPRCRNQSRLPIKAVFSDTEFHEDDASQAWWEAGDVFHLLQCHVCKSVILRLSYYHSHADDDEFEGVTLYPIVEQSPLGLPPKIAAAYESAMRVKRIDPNAYAVLLRRLLELICLDRGAKQKDRLYDQLHDLAARGEVPSNLVNFADGLRKIGNIGAHASEGEIVPALIPYLDRMARALIEYIYTAPHIVKQLEEEMNKLKKSTSK